MVYRKVMHYETFIIVGALMAILSFLNAINAIDISSDFFWMLAGMGLIIEGFLELAKWKDEQKNLKIRIKPRK